MVSCPYDYGFKPVCPRSSQHQVATRRNIESLLRRIIMTATISVENLRQYKSGFSLIVELTLPFDSSHS